MAYKLRTTKWKHLQIAIVVCVKDAPKWSEAIGQASPWTGSRRRPVSRPWSPHRRPRSPGPHGSPRRQQLVLDPEDQFHSEKPD